jgi:hypothetical protein
MVTFCTLRTTNRLERGKCYKPHLCIGLAQPGAGQAKHPPPIRRRNKSGSRKMGNSRTTSHVTGLCQDQGALQSHTEPYRATSTHNNYIARTGPRWEERSVVNFVTILTPTFGPVYPDNVKVSLLSILP